MYCDHRQRSQRDGNIYWLKLLFTEGTEPYFLTVITLHMFYYKIWLSLLLSKLAGTYIT